MNNKNVISDDFNSDNLKRDLQLLSENVPALIKQTKLSLMSIIEDNFDVINEMLENKCPKHEIVKRFANNGVLINENTLRSYISKIRKLRAEAQKPSKKRKKKTEIKNDVVEEIFQSEPHVEVQSEVPQTQPYTSTTPSLTQVSSPNYRQDIEGMDWENN